MTGAIVVGAGVVRAVESKDKREGSGSLLQGGAEASLPVVGDVILLETVRAEASWSVRG